jgi:hypothetical protein
VVTPANTQHWPNLTGCPLDLKYCSRMPADPVHCHGGVPLSYDPLQLPTKRPLSSWELTRAATARTTLTALARPPWSRRLFSSKNITAGKTALLNCRQKVPNEHKIREGSFKLDWKEFNKRSEGADRVRWLVVLEKSGIQMGNWISLTETDWERVNG